MKSKLNIKSILIIAIIGVISLVFFNPSLAANTAKVTVETANIRKSADANSTIVEQASKGQEVEILEKTGDWYKVKYNNIEGYLRNDLVDVKVENTTENVTANTNTTTSVETKTEKETSAEQTKTETATEETEVKDETTGMYTCKENVKLKILPLILGNDIKEINKDATVNVLEINNKWALVESETSRGWVLVSKLEKVANVEKPQTESEENKEEQKEEENKEEKKEETTEVKQEEKNMYVNSEVVNLREGETTSSESLAQLPKGTVVTVVSENNGWSKVKVSGKEGYISSALLSANKPEVTTSRSIEQQRQDNSETETKKETQKSKETNNVAATSSSGSASGAAIVENAKSYIGSSYVYGGSSPSGFDCSGFTQYIYKQAGVSINRTAQAQYSNGTSVSKSELQLGDLVMFGSSSSNINHVGIYMGNGKIVHAANSRRGVTTDTINSGYYNNNYVGARRIVN